MSLIASTSTDFKCHRWPEGTLEHVYVPQNYHDGTVRSISWSKDGTWATLVPSSGPAQIISVKNNIKLIHTIKDVHGPSCALFQNDSKKYVALGTSTGHVLVYDVKAGGVRKKFPRANAGIFSLSYSYKDSHLAAATSSREIILYSNTTGDVSAVYRVPQSDTVSVINFHRAKRNYFAAGSEEGLITCWDINNNGVIFHAQAHQAPVTAITFSPIRNDLLATAGLDRRFSFYDIVSKINILDVGVASCVTSADYSYCGKYIALGHQDGNIAIYDIRTFNKPISTFVAHEGRKVQNVLFQKPTNGASSTERSIIDNISEPTPGTPQSAQTSQSYDSFGLMLSSQEQKTDTVDLPSQTQETADSFMIEMGLADSATPNQESSIEVTDSNKKIPNIPKSISLNKTKTFLTSITKSSTPKFFNEELPKSSESPILAMSSQTIPVSNQTEIGINKQEINEMIRNCVKDEMETFKIELKNEMMHMRQHVFDLHISIIKQFVNMESSLNKINGLVPKESNNGNEDLLIQTIHGLKQQVDALRSEIMGQNQTK